VGVCVSYAVWDVGFLLLSPRGWEPLPIDTACTGRVPRHMMHHSHDHLGSHYLRDHSTQRQDGGRDSEGYVGVATGTYHGPQQGVHRAWTPSGGLEGSQRSSNPQTREAGLVIAPRQHQQASRANGSTSYRGPPGTAGQTPRWAVRMPETKIGGRCGCCPHEPA